MLVEIDTLEGYIKMKQALFDTVVEDLRKNPNHEDFKDALQFLESRSEYVQNVLVKRVESERPRQRNIGKNLKRA